MGTNAAIRSDAFQPDKVQAGGLSLVWPLAAIALALILQFHLLITRSINWDEFFYYGQIEDFARGSLTSGLQTVHVRLFAWLLGLPGDTIDHIIVGRAVMFAAELVTLGAIYLISAKFADRLTGAICALAYLASIYAFQHGFSFRTDPLATALAMSALAVLLRSRLGWLGILGFTLLLGSAELVTIKCVLFAPAFCGIAWMRFSQAGFAMGMAVRLAFCAFGAAAVFYLLYIAHLSGLSEKATANLVGGSSGAASYVFQAGLPFYMNFFVRQMVLSGFVSVLLLISPFALYRSGLPNEQKVAITGLLATFLVVFFYVNALAYFYAFLMAPVVAGIGFGVVAVARRYSPVFVVIGLVFSVVCFWALDAKSPIEEQRKIIGAAGEIFPQPVRYFDFCDMLPGFEKSNPFMTTWGMHGYTSAGVPIMRQTMEREVVPLVLASEQSTYLTFEEMLTTTGPSPYFVEEDAAALRDNYLRFWGPYWLAGKEIAPGDAMRSDEFLVPGAYTVHDAPLEFDGTRYEPGDVLQVTRGVHDLRAAAGRPARMFWGVRLTPPAERPPERPYWIDF